MSFCRPLKTTQKLISGIKSRNLVLGCELNLFVPQTFIELLLVKNTKCFWESEDE